MSCAVKKKTNIALPSSPDVELPQPQSRLPACAVSVSDGGGLGWGGHILSTNLALPIPQIPDHPRREGEPGRLLQDGPALNPDTELIK